MECCARDSVDGFVQHAGYKSRESLLGRCPHESADRIVQRCGYMSQDRLCSAAPTTPSTA
eukprot:1516588-Alexandrium_andersonii.AAC.1